VNVTTVRVTDRHIAEGVSCNSAACPIALALLDALVAEGVRVDSLFVDETDARVVTWCDTAGALKFRADLPAEATEFVRSFDDGEAVGPIEVELSWRDVAS
jgi:hypothetical protein